MPEIKTKHQQPLILLTIFLTITVLIVYFDYLTGNKLLIFSDWGSDTKDSYLMYYGSTINKLMAGDFNFYDFKLGIGADIATAQATVFDPFSLLIYLFTMLSGMENLAHVITIVQIVKIYFAGYACYFFLHALKSPARVRVITAYIFAFCGVMMQWGQLYIFSSAIALFPLLLYAIERSFECKKALILLAAMVAVSLVFSVYFAYMFLLVGFLYALLRFFQRNEKTSFALFKQQLLPIIGFAALGAVISFAITLPVLNLMLHSTERLASSGTGLLENMLHLYSPGGYYNILMRAFSNNFMGFGNSLIGEPLGDPNPYGVLQTFFSLLFILIAPQYLISLFRRKQSRGQRASYIISVLLVAAMFVWPFASYVLNGFQYPNSRHSIVMVPFLAIAVAGGLKAVFVDKKLNVPALFIALGVSAAVILRAYFVVDSMPGIGDIAFYKQFILANIAIAAAMAILLLLVTKKIRQGWLYIGLCAAVVVNMSWDAHLTQNYRSNVTNEEYAAVLNESVTAAIGEAKSLEGDGFFRLEKTFSALSPYEESGIQDYNGVSMYSSLPSKHSLQFARQLWPALLSNDQFMYTLTVREEPVIEALVGMKYSLTTNVDYNMQAYEALSDYNGIQLVQNTYAQNAAYLFPAVISEESFATLDAAQRDTALTQAVIATQNGSLAVKYPYDLSSSGYSRISEQIDYDAIRLLSPSEIITEYITINAAGNAAATDDPGGTVSITSAEDGQLLLDLTKTAALAIPLTDAVQQSAGQQTVFSFMLSAPSYNAVTLTFLDAAGEKTGPPVSFVTQAGGTLEKQVKAVLPSGTKNIQALVESPGAGITFSDMILATRNTPAFNESYGLRQIKSDHLVCDTQSQSAGVLYVPIAYQDGWQVVVDGQPQPLMLLNYGFMGVELAPGPHTVEFRYTPPMFLPGAVCSAAGIGIVILFYFLRIRKKRKKTEA
ncbi:MAG: YfhO family protein [Christensenellaceae bacterium]|jgi:uncharacterized membrane protein YfhO